MTDGRGPSWLEDVPRPGFAEELLIRLVRDDDRRALGNGLRNVVAGALGGATVTASVALMLASRRRSR